MVKLLIVENDITIRMGLIKLISTMELSISQILDVNNGQECLDILGGYQPDIIITDIRMPIMDGLEMIRCIRQMGLYDIKIIIVSGYSDFTYAQMAIEYNVTEYLLKAIRPDKLRLALVKAINLNSDAEKHRNEVEQADVQNQEYRNMVLKEIMQDTFPRGQINRAIHSVCPDHQMRKFFVVNISTKLDYHDVIEFVKECVNTMNRLECNYISKNGKFIFLLSCNHKDSIFYNEFYDCTKAFILRIKEAQSINISAGISDLQKGISRINTLTEHASEAMEYQILLNEKLIVYSDISVGNTTEKHLKVYIYEVIEAINNHNPRSSLNGLDKLFNAMENTPNLSPKCVRRCIVPIIDIIENETLQPVDLRLKVDNIYRNSISLTDFKMSIKEIIIQKMPVMKSVADNINNGAHIARAIEYININYYKNLQLEDVAHDLNIHPSYLSSLFKKRTGMTYTEYLTSIRMNEAKELLKISRLKVFEISDKVGMEEKYFSRLFKKVCNMTPSQYRKLHWK